MPKVKVFETSEEMKKNLECVICHGPNPELIIQLTAFGPQLALVHKSCYGSLKDEE